MRPSAAKGTPRSQADLSEQYPRRAIRHCRQRIDRLCGSGPPYALAVTMEPRPPEDDDATARPEEAPPPGPVAEAWPAPLPWEHTVGDAASTAPEPQLVDDEAEVSWAPAEDESRDVPGAPGLIYAGVVRRTASWLVDMFLIAVLSIVILLVLIALIVGTPEPGDTALSTVAWVGIAVIAAVYFIVFWTGARRATPGMRILSLQVGNFETGATLTPDQAAIRVAALGIVMWPLIAVPAIGVVGGFALFVWPIVLLVSTALNGRRRGIHDRIAGTAIVQPGGTKSSS
jgi:uncharacterized RDD family membrane protein YckC